MVRITFIALVIMHGLIHAIGFLKAFHSGSNTLLNREISKPMGLLWLTAVALLLGSALFLILNKNWWHVGIAAATLSQILLASVWQSARWGTVVNLIIVGAAIVNLSAWLFQRNADNAALQLVASAGSIQKVITEADIATLPPIVARWLSSSGVVGKPVANTICLKQSGRLRTSPHGSWTDVTATQYFNTSDPSFIWIARIHNPYIHISGRDDFYHGHGRMLISIGSMVTVANATGPETDQGTMLRYLAEIQWFPSAALDSHITWQQIDEQSARATLSYPGSNVTGIFSFDQAGNIRSFAADRYMEHNGAYTLEKWYVPVTSCTTFNGIRIPSAGQTIWRLKDGDFSWFDWKIDSITFNQPCLLK